jgi:hypothetical protein
MCKMAVSHVIGSGLVEETTGQLADQTDKRTLIILQPSPTLLAWNQNKIETTRQLMLTQSK